MSQVTGSNALSLCNLRELSGLRGKSFGSIIHHRDTENAEVAQRKPWDLACSSLKNEKTRRALPFATGLLYRPLAYVDTETAYLSAASPAAMFASPLDA